MPLGPCYIGGAAPGRVMRFQGFKVGLNRCRRERGRGDGTAIRLQTSRCQGFNDRCTPALYAQGAGYWASGCPSFGTRF